MIGGGGGQLLHPLLSPNGILSIGAPIWDVQVLPSVHIETGAKKFASAMLARCAVLNVCYLQAETEVEEYIIIRIIMKNIEYPLTVRANSWIRYGASPGASVPDDPVHPTP